MKYAFFGALLLWTSMAFGDDYRLFTAEDGRKIEGKILTCDMARGRVHIERRNRKKVWVPFSVFTEEDKAYIKEWATGDLFLGASKLRVKLEKQTDSVKSGDKVYYDVNMSNRSGVDFENITIEYRLFITTKGSGQIVDTTRYVAGEIDVGTIRKGESRTVSSTPELLTEKVEEVPVSYRETDSYGMVVSVSYEMEVRKLWEEFADGVWLRIKGPEVGGVPVVRSVTLPEDLNEKVEWVEAPAESEVLADSNSKPTQKQSLEELLALYEKRDAGSLAHKIGKKYLWDKRERDFQKAEEWMDVAAEKGDMTGYNSLAMFYACTKEKEFRDGEKAVKYALLLKRKYGGEAWFLDTLACAYARNGQFELATKTQKKACSKASRASGPKGKALEAFYIRLERFKQGKAWPN